MAERIFDEKTLRKLEQLTIIANKIRAGAIKGERRSSRRGTSIEFADYRSYVRGDDLRRVDWNIYARLQRPFIKLLEDEEDLALYLIFDASASMDWPRTGERALHKFLYARRLVAGLGYIGLGTGDHVMVAALRGDAVPRWGPLRGRGHALTLLHWLEDQYTRGEVELNETLRAFANRTPRPGVVIVVTDMMSPKGYEEGLRALQGRGHEVTVIQPLAPDELSPELTGDLKLIDVETGFSQEVTIDAAMRALYLQRLQSWQGEINTYCVRRGIHYLPVSTGQPWEQVILSELRRANVVR